MKRKLVFEDVHQDSAKKKCLTGPESSVGEVDFEPLHFLRCHSRNNDAADVQTQVWHCAFEPKLSGTKESRTVATCGGNSVCFIDVKTGQVIGKYYSDDTRDLFYSVCWTSISTLKSKQVENILAVGGAKRCVYLLHPQNALMFSKFRMKSVKKCIISSVLFHPTEPHILFCALSDGTVQVFDIGTPLPPTYSTKFDHLFELLTKSEIFSLSFSLEWNTLLAACNEGLFGWKIYDVERLEKNVQLRFEMPARVGPGSKGRPQLVDSVEALANGLVAAKCALHGNIYVWSLPSAIETETAGSSRRMTITVAPTHVLRWRDTDNYFMNIGHSLDILACGDDRGSIWLYDMHLLNFAGNQKVEPLNVLEWPKVIDVHSDRKRKLKLDVNDIVIDKVVVSQDSRYLVAVTSNNMVCVWKQK